MNLLSTSEFVHNLSLRSIIPECFTQRKKQKLSKNCAEIIKSEPIHNLVMPDLCTNISFSRNQKYLFILGAYGSRVRCYELEKLSLQFDRDIIELPKQIAHIDDDYSKFVLLEGEKTLSFHSTDGIHTKIYCPYVSTDLIYSSFRRQLFIPNTNGEILILDVEKCIFCNSIRNESISSSINCAAHNILSNVFLAGQSSGNIYGLDFRNAENCFEINVPEVCKVAFKNPATFGVGTERGMFYLYDIRNLNKSLLSRDLKHEFPIKSILFDKNTVIAAVQSFVKIFNLIDEGENGEQQIISYDTDADINNLVQFPKSGLFLSASNQPEINTYYFPKIGNAPSWIKQRTKFIADIEIEKQSFHKSHRFITRQKVIELNLERLIGTKELRAHANGFYISDHDFNTMNNSQS